MPDTPPSDRALRVLWGDSEARRCTATSKSTGLRCARSSSVGAFTCDRHGGKSPWSIAAARERMQALTDSAIGVLQRATRRAEACEHCGRADSDRDQASIRAAIAILDRTGLGVSAHLTVTTATETSRTSLPTSVMLSRAEALVVTLRAKLVDEEGHSREAFNARCIDGDLEAPEPSEGEGITNRDSVYMPPNDDTVSIGVPSVRVETGESGSHDADLLSK